MNEMQKICGEKWPDSVHSQLNIHVCTAHNMKCRYWDKGWTPNLVCPAHHLFYSVVRRITIMVFQMICDNQYQHYQPLPLNVPSNQYQHHEPLPLNVHSNQYQQHHKPLTLNVPTNQYQHHYEPLPLDVPSVTKTSTLLLTELV